MSPAFIALQGIKERAGRQIPVRTQEITAAAECNLLGRLHIVRLQKELRPQAAGLKEAILKKPAEHCFTEIEKVTETKRMTEIGG